MGASFSYLTLKLSHLHKLWHPQESNQGVLFQEIIFKNSSLSISLSHQASSFKVVVEFFSKEKIHHSNPFKIFHYSSMTCRIHLHTWVFGFFGFLMVSSSQGYYTYILNHISKLIASSKVIVSLFWYYSGLLHANISLINYILVYG